MEPLLANLTTEARQVLDKNHRDGWTQPAAKLYPHQWLWDSAFIAIGLATYAPKRATEEIQSIFRAQWQNGMLPHTIFSAQTGYWAGPELWQSHISPHAPRDVQTSGITQPPVIAISCLRVAESLGPASRRDFLKSVYEPLLTYHRWIYRERDPENTGLAVVIHPWESGLDNTPPWMDALRRWRPPAWINLLANLGITRMIHIFRTDKTIPQDQRPSGLTGLKAVALANYYREHHYDSVEILKRPAVAVEDLTFNSTLIAANSALERIANIIGRSLPEDLRHKAKQTRSALEELWDEPSGQYFSRDFITKKLIRVSSIAALMPLISGAISTERAAQLGKQLLDPKQFWTRFPVPSVPLNSRYFNERRYWQGPTWLNMNWLIIEGLKNYGQTKLADRLVASTLEMVSRAGMREYFSPLTGEGYGASNFSWTAALVLDLLNTPK